MLTLNQFNPDALLSLIDNTTPGPPPALAAPGPPAPAALGSPAPGQHSDVTVTSSHANDLPFHPGDSFHTTNSTTLLDKDVSDQEELFHVEQSLTVSYTAEAMDSPHSSVDYEPNRILTAASRDEMMSSLDCDQSHRITDQTTGTSSALEHGGSRRTSRLKKRTSVDTLPSHHVQRRTSTPKISKTASVGDAGEIPAVAVMGSSRDSWPMAVLPAGELRVCNSDSHLSVGLSRADPMISMIDHDINSPPITFTSDNGEIPPVTGFHMGASSYLLPCEAMSIDIGMFLYVCFCIFIIIMIVVIMILYNMHVMVSCL